MSVVRQTVGPPARQSDPPLLSVAERVPRGTAAGHIERTRTQADPPAPLSPAERADLTCLVEGGWLVVQTPEETEDWHRRRHTERLMSEAIEEKAAYNNIAALNEALAAAQGEFPAIPRDKEVTVQTKTGGSYKFKYAPLDAIFAAVRPVLAKHRLSITQLLADNGAGPMLRTELRHADGSMVVSTLKLPAVDGGPQALGSLLTYFRRYAIVALLGIAAEEDDDGNQAQDAAEGSAAPAPTGKTTAGPQMITEAQHRKMGAQVRELTEKWPTGGLTSWPDRLREQFHVRSRKDLTKHQAGEAIEWLQQHLDMVPELKTVGEGPGEQSELAKPGLEATKSVGGPW